MKLKNPVSIGRLGLRGKFLIVYFLVVALLMFTIGFIYFKTTSAVLYNIITTDTVNLLKKNNLIIDQRLGLINEYSNGITVDHDLSEYLEMYSKAQSDFEVYSLDRPVSQLLKKYFLYANEIFSTNLITKRIAFGQTNTSNIIPVDKFKNTDIYSLAVNGKGRTVWIPTYNFFEMFSQGYISSSETTYQNVFSAVKLVKTFDDDYAILIIVFLDDIYSNVFNTNSIYNKGKYLVVSPEGRVVSHTDKSLIGTTLDIPWLAKAFNVKNGFDTIQIGNKNYIVCYDVSETTGWLSGIILESEALMNDYVGDIIKNMLILLAILIVIPSFIIMLISKLIIQPMDALRQGMKESGQGRFDIEIQEKGLAEFRQLIRRFNKMNNRIQQLIRENYEMIIMKKEAELNAYSLQLNPHFISNSLNIINLQLIHNKEYDLSDMVVELSQMMDYTLNTTDHLVSFKNDWQHTYNYIKIMQRRYKYQFDFEYDIQPQVFNYSVPKFFLQPLVENSFVHGFVNINYKGLIKVSAYIDDNKRIYVVEDNGKGIDKNTKERILNDDNKSVGINNVRYRIKYIYGDKYELSIESEPFISTKITIILPLE